MVLVFKIRYNNSSTSFIPLSSILYWTVNSPEYGPDDRVKIVLTNGESFDLKNRYYYKEHPDDPETVAEDLERLLNKPF